MTDFETALGPVIVDRADELREARIEAVELAGALERKVDDVFDRNAALLAENESLRAEVAALHDERDYLRKTLDARTRERNAAIRAADALDENMRKIQITANEVMRSVHPKERLAPPPVASPSAAMIEAPTMNGGPSPH